MYGLDVPTGTRGPIFTHELALDEYSTNPAYMQKLTLSVHMFPSTHSGACTRLSVQFLVRSSGKAQHTPTVFNQLNYSAQYRVFGLVSYVFGLFLTYFDLHLRSKD
ncbi:hypothetical protein SDJN03_30160, partial [Cucurbita argyrosperma subsp. sororia]